MTKYPFNDINKCTGCGKCVTICPRNAISISFNTVCAKCIKYCIEFPVPCKPEHITFNYNLCTSCGLCVDNCPSKAIYFLE